MAKYCLAAFAVLFMVDLISSQDATPKLYVVNNATDLCPTYTGNPEAIGTINSKEPCKLNCMVPNPYGTMTAVPKDKKDGEECSAPSAPDNLPKLCLKGKCTDQIKSKEDDDKGHPCTGYGGFKAVQKPGVPCVLTCVPDPEGADKDSPINYEVPVKIEKSCQPAPNKRGICVASGTTSPAICKATT